MSRLSDISYIKDVMERHGTAFSKALGQNFLINPSICPKMAENSGADENTGVIEVGPGIGVLTYELSKVAKKVVSIELDKRLLSVLEETLSDCSNVKIINDDVLKADINKIIEEEFGGEKVCVCANLPYYITSPVIMHFLEGNFPLKALTVMVQKEAAERICAKPGSRESGAITISIHYYCEPELLFKVSRGSFLPAPNVDSAVIKLNIREKPPVEPKNKELFFKVIKAAFSQRRKTAVNSVASGLSLNKALVTEAFEKANLPIDIRAEKMDLKNFSNLSDVINEIIQ
ncbi:MAG: 16S rRNA (adenine(1518)-N(6)/adenine(1519)-N(6))-dimethyltransferase RsmA [Ruminococcaceae bacterium]|nr:16S rRNA (adenine(1518)-N(6)/adenine(1519)-N(6))-dimethyltransferase RsmA [Oscillospiraceae bacterium]